MVRVLRVSHNAKLRIQQLAAEAGVSTSEWVRQAVVRQLSAVHSMPELINTNQSRRIYVRT